MQLNWITPTYEVPVVSSLPSTGTHGQFIFVGTVTSTTRSGTYYQYDTSVNPAKWVDLGPVAGFKAGNLPTGTSPLQLQDTKSGNFANLFVVNVEDPAPLIVADQGFVIKKDLAVGGNILTLQGAMIFGHGWTGSAVGNTIIAQSPPLIELLHSNEDVKSGASLPIATMRDQSSQIFFNTTDNTLYIWDKYQWHVFQKNPAGGSVPKYDTLFLVKNDGYRPAHMNMGNLFVQGSAYVKMGGQACGQLMIENTNPSGGVLSIGVGDSGMYPYRAWIGCPYGTNSINDFAYGIFLGLTGQSAIVLAARWANADKMVLDQTGNLSLPSYNAGIEVGHPTTGGTPYIDFHFGKGVSQDFNVRLINNADGWLRLEGHFNVGGDVKLEHSGPVYLNVNSTNSNTTVVNLARGGNTQAMFGVGTNSRAYINTASGIPLDLSSPAGVYAQSDLYADSFLPRAGNNTGTMGNGSRYWNGIVVNSLYHKSSSSFGCERSLSGQEWVPGFKDRISAEQALSDELTRPRYHILYDTDSDDKIVCTCGKKVAMPCPEHLEDWNSRYTVNMSRITHASGYLALELNADVAKQTQKILQLEGEVAELKNKLAELSTKKSGE
jgi:hypothetical protein